MTDTAPITTTTTTTTAGLGRQTQRRKRSASDASLAAQEARPEPLPAWVVQLRDKGYAVVPGVLSDAECEAVFAKVKVFFAAHGVDLSARNAPKYPNIHGIVQHMGVGHSQAVWDVRLNQRVQDVFARLYGTNDLLVSFDGLCVMQPWRRFGTKSWLHFDQGPRRQGRHCIQGYVNILDSSDATSGSLSVVPGSHLKHADFWRRFPDAAAKAGSNDWYKLANDEQRSFFDGEAVRVHGPRGSLVLWDSRTLHQNMPASDEPKNWRCVVYTCYQPRSLATDRLLAKKAAAFDDYRMTTHWPAEQIKLFPKSWRTFGEPVPANLLRQHRDRVSTTRMLELAGKQAMPADQRTTTAPSLSFD
jgi:hypothetical protein